MRPPTLPYTEGRVVPPGYHLEQRYDKPMLIAGGVMFGSMYLLSAVAAAAAEGKDGSAVMAVPVAGPFIAAERVRFARGNDGWSGIENFFSGMAVVGLVFDGVVQASGAVLLSVGLMPKSVLVREDFTRSRVRVTPLATKDGGMGIGIAGAM